VSIDGASALSADWRMTRTRTRLAVMAAVGIATAVLVGVFGSWLYAPLLGWDAAAAVFTGWVWAAVGRMDPTATRAYATREDPSRGPSDVLVLAASVASLAAVGAVLVQAASAKGGAQGLLAGLAVGSVVVSWFTVHTLFTLRYAALYHASTGAGIDFNQDGPPRYTDFAYVAFTIGATFQVSDTDLKSHTIRVTALRHSLLSYLFGSVILAATINLLVSLTSSSNG